MKHLFLLLLFPAACYGQTCKGIQKKTSKFDNKTNYTSIVMGSIVAMGSSTVDAMVLGKTVTPADTSYVSAVAASVVGVRGENGLKGVTYLFSDGTRLEKPTQVITLKFGNSSNSLNAEVVMSSREFALFSTKTLADIKMGNDEFAVNSKLTRLLPTQAACMLKTW